MSSHLTRRDSSAPFTRGLRAVLASLVMVFAVAAATLAPAASSSAADLPGAVTSVSTDKTTYGYNERIVLSFDWSVPDTAVAGDSFTLDLPDELKTVSLAKFALLAADGSIVANATWAGKTLVVTLTDYVDTHDGVAGSGFLTVQWDHTFTPETSQPIVLDFDSNAVEVVIGDKPTPPTPCTENCPPPPATPTTRSLGKSGGWADGSFEGTRDETGNINWTIALPGNETGFAGPIEIVDTPALGSVIECATIKITTQNSLANGTPKLTIDPARVVVNCSPASFTIMLDSIAASEFVTITYKGTITNQLSGVYANHVEVTIAGVTTVKETTIKRTGAGGNGGGVQSVSVGNYVWLDADNDGIQDAAEFGIEGVTLTLTGPDGLPVKDITGAPVAPTVTDATGHYAFAKLPVLSTGQHYTVTIDKDASSAALANLVPTVPGAGLDESTDSSTDSAESTDLTTNGAKDETLDFGFVGSVAVGDYVWLDFDADGTQDGDEKGVRDVTLTLTGPDGLAVTDVNGVLVGPTATDVDGRYEFAHLPTLPAGEHYTVTIDATASAKALQFLSPTIPGAGDDHSADSSTGSAESIDLTVNGARDDTLDFGFVFPQLPTLPLTPAALAFTGSGGLAPALAAALGLIIAGIVSAKTTRRRRA